VSRAGSYHQINYDYHVLSEKDVRGILTRQAVMETFRLRARFQIICEPTSPLVVHICWLRQWGECGLIKHWETGLLLHMNKRYRSALTNILLEHRLRASNRVLITIHF
jgi:hypothetical protein